MENQYSEISQNRCLSENQRYAKSADKSNAILFIIALIISLLIIGLAAWGFCNNNIYKGDNDWVIKHDVVGTYGDFIGGVLGTMIALYSAYLLVRTLGNQLSVNGDVMDTNKNVIKTNNKTIYQSFLQIFDNKFSTQFGIYQQAKLNYQCEIQKVQKKVIENGATQKKIIIHETIVIHGAEALEHLATQFSKNRYTDKRTYLSRVKSATNAFDEFYSEHRREMSVHFRNLYLLAKYVGETDNVDEEGNIKLTEQDRVEYAKSIRGQLSEGEMLLLRYNCLTSRGEKMRTFVNQFNLIKHLPVMSLLEFQKHRDKLRSYRDANTLDTHFIALKKRMKEYIGFATNEQTSKWNFSVKYSIEMELSVDRKQFKLTVKRMKNRPATGSDGTPPIEKALNCFTGITDIKELYKDFVREALLVSNFYLYNGSNNNNITGKENSDAVYDYAILEYVSNYPIAVSEL
jgi:hypothetical protein